MRILPLGSCRIWNPLYSLPEADRPIKLFKGNTVYSHTPAAALVLLKVLKGDLALPAGWHKYLTPSPPLTLTDEAQQWARSPDVCFVEVCAEYEYHVGDIALIDNELIRQLRSPGEDVKVGWWQALQANRPFTAVDILSRLSLVADTRRLDDVDRQVISEVRLRRLTPDRLAADLTALRDAVGCPLVVVPHVSFRKNDGQPLEARDRFIQTVHATARDLDLPIVDHSALVEHVGHARFWERDGTDSHHFTKEMNPEVAELMLRTAQAA